MQTMLLGTLLSLLALASSVLAKDTSSNQFYSTSISTLSSASVPAFTDSKYTYATSSGQVTVGTASSASASASASASQSTRSTTSKKLTTIGGISKNQTATSTTSAARPTNTVPCNGWPEFCTRKYSNITYVCAHNSAFVLKNNAGSNQALPVRDQLNDGIRMIQGETHYVNNTIMNCHSTCQLLDVGPWEDELVTVVDWLRQNPYEVVTWLIVNSDFVSVEKYLPALKKSGMIDYLYEPTYIPQHRDQWPTIGEMILSGKRVVMFMDYNANQTAVPYILDEFTHIWETPFSPTNRSFPCTQQRPPGLSRDDAKKNYMYLANHNLNTAVDLSALLGTASGEILIPNTADINITNGDYNQYSQLEAMSQNCTSDWGLPPNFLLVDYYNYGVPRPGSVFEVAARANGVKYDWRCCGSTTSSAPTLTIRRSCAVALVAIAFAFVFNL